MWSLPTNSMEQFQAILFKNEFALSVIGVPPSSLEIGLRPFQSTFPVELVHYILYLAALDSTNNNGRREYRLLKVSKPIRKYLFRVFFETLEIVGMERMISFARVFAPALDKSGASPHLITSTVKRLALIDNKPGDIQNSDLIIPPDLLSTILSLCSNTQILFLNYIRPIPEVDSFRPTELTVRRGLRYEQAFPSLILSQGAKLYTPLLTHLCFTHHLDFPDRICTDIVENCIGTRSTKHKSEQQEGHDSATALVSPGNLSFPNLSVVIIEIAFQKWDVRTDPSLRIKLAAIPDPQNQLFVRVSPYNTALPVDGLLGPTGLVVGGTQAGAGSSSFSRDVWDVSDCLDWRTNAWAESYIEERIAQW